MMKNKQLIDLLQKVNQLKSIKRTGWVREKVPDAESDADHTFQLAFMAMILAEELDVDQLKVIKMALIHDVAEYVVGDVVWERGKKIDDQLRVDKEAQELEVAKDLFSNIDPEYSELFEEYIKRETREAQIVWELDKLERAFQAYEYQNETGKDLSEFYDSGELFIKDPKLIKLLREIWNK